MFQLTIPCTVMAGCSATARGAPDRRPATDLSYPRCSRICGRCLGRGPSLPTSATEFSEATSAPLTRLPTECPQQAERSHDSCLPRLHRRHRRFMQVHHYWFTVPPLLCVHETKPSKKMPLVRFATRAFTPWVLPPLPHKCPQLFRNAGPHSLSPTACRRIRSACAAVASDSRCCRSPDKHVATT